MNKAKKDLLDALERLQEGRPSNARLKQAAMKGRLVINPTTVAREAGRSRTLIGGEGCSYPDIRAQVLGFGEPRASLAATDKESNDVRAELVRLRAERAQLATELADVKASLWRLQRRVDFLAAVGRPKGEHTAKVVSIDRPPQK